MGFLASFVRYFPRMMVIAATLFFFFGDMLVSDFACRFIIMMLGAAIFLAAKTFESNVTGENT